MSNLRALTRTRCLPSMSCAQFLDKKMKPCLRLALLGLFTSSTILASCEENSCLTPGARAGAPVVDVAALRKSVKITLDQAIFADDPHIKCALYGASAQTWEVILREDQELRDDDIISPGVYFANAAHFARSPLDKTFYNLKANAFWEDYFKRVPNPAPSALRYSAWSAHETAHVTANLTQKAALLARCVELWDRYMFASAHPVVSALQQAARSYCSALSFAQNAAQKEALALKSARAWDAYFTHIPRPDDEKTFEDAAKAYDAVVSYAQDSVIRDTYRQKGSLMGVVFPKNS